MEILDSLEYYYRELGFSCIQASGERWLDQHENRSARLKICRREDEVRFVKREDIPRLRELARPTVILIYVYTKPTTLKVVAWPDNQSKGYDFDLNDPKSLTTLHELITTHLCSTPSQPTTKTKATS